MALDATVSLDYFLAANLVSRLLRRLGIRVQFRSRDSIWRYF